MTLLQIHEPGQTPLPHAQDDDLAVGIDLGTTHSVMGLMHEGGGVDLLIGAHGSALFPSVVAYDPQQPEGYRVGMDALGLPQAIHAIKRIMGKIMDEVIPIRDQLPFKVMASDLHALPVIQMGSNRVHTAIECAAMILGYLRDQATQILGRPVHRAVITVPAYFDDAARLATKQAAHLAGWTVLRLIHEPTAAALAYGLESAPQEGLFAVYDWGGGTFDVSILRRESGVFQVLATGGDSFLGGDDLDFALGQALEAMGCSLDDLSPDARITALRQLRHALGACDSLMFRGYHLSRAWLWDIITPWVDRTLDLFQSTLDDAHLKPQDLLGIVLVGGVTRTPWVRQQLVDRFGVSLLCDHNPDEVVARGAARHAYQISHRSLDELLLDVLPLSLGLETMGGLVEKMIPRNTPIPAAYSQEFTTHVDGQTGMVLHVVQGEREQVSDNRSLAQFHLDHLPSQTAGTVRVRVMFQVDADGLLTVTAQEKSTGQSISVAVHPRSGLDDAMLRSMLDQGWQHAQHDMAHRLWVESRVEAERLCGAVDHALESDADLLSPQEHTRIVAVLDTLKQAIREGWERDKLESTKDQLIQLTHDWGHAHMNRHVHDALHNTVVGEHKPTPHSAG